MIDNDFYIANSVDSRTNDFANSILVFSANQKDNL